jgi:hypothetical protein
MSGKPEGAGGPIIHSTGYIYLHPRDILMFKSVRRATQDGWTHCSRKSDGPH